MLESTSLTSISGDVTSNVIVLNDFMSSESPYCSEFRNKEKGRHTRNLYFLPRSQHKIEKWRNSHWRKRLFYSSSSIM